MKKLMTMMIAGVVALSLSAALGGTAQATHVTDVEIDTVTLNANGSLTVEGTVSCNEGSVNSTSVTIRAVQGATDQTGFSAVFSPCDDPGNTYNYSVTLAGPYTTGNVKVTATTDCCDDATNTVPLTDTHNANCPQLGRECNLNNGQGTGKDPAALAATRCANSGAGNAGELSNEECLALDGETGDTDPGNSGKNNAPNTPPGQTP